MLKRKRIIAIAIDYYIAFLLCYVPMLIIGKGFKFLLENMYLLIVSNFLLFIVKDIVFKNCSMGKKTMKIEVLKQDGTKPNTLHLLLRNIFAIIWPIEIFLILSKNKRLGDLIFNTKVSEKK